MPQLFETMGVNDAKPCSWGTPMPANRRTTSSLRREGAKEEQGAARETDNTRKSTSKSEQFQNVGPGARLPGFQFGFSLSWLQTLGSAT